MATSWVAGAGPGLLAAALSAMSAHYLFSEAGHSTASGSPSVVLFALEATVLCLLTATFRQRLVETEAHLGRVFEDSPLGILILEGGSRILKANSAFREFLGLDRGNLEGRAVMDYVHPDSRERVAGFLADLTRTQTAVVAERIRFASGPTTAWANLHGSWIRENHSHVPTCLIMVEDITERRKAEEALIETEARLQRGQKMEALGLLAGGVAHDFNNLLAVIFASGERLLYEKDLPPEARKGAEEILRTAKTAADFTRQLLTFARRRPPTDRVVDLNALVLETAGLLQRLIGARVDLKIVLAPDAGAVRTDASQLQQVLMNLAVNARDAMPSGGRLTIRTSRTAAEEAMAGGPFGILQVSDTGHGMDEATQARIFEPLFSTKDFDKGTGLGLATVHSIVSKLGGHISVESSPGKGTCFTVHLPGANLERAPSSTGKGAVAQARSAALSERHVTEPGP